MQDYGGKVAAGQVVSHAPVPPGWKALVDASREYIGQWEAVTHKDTFFIRYAVNLPSQQPSMIITATNRVKLYSTV